MRNTKIIKILVDDLEFETMFLKDRVEQQNKVITKLFDVIKRQKIVIQEYEKKSVKYERYC